MVSWSDIYCPLCSLQERVFPNNLTFESPEAQELYIREWARKRTGLDCDFKVTFYPGRYAAEKGEPILRNTQLNVEVGLGRCLGFASVQAQLLVARVAHQLL